MNGTVHSRLPAEVLEAIKILLQKKSGTQAVSTFEAIQEVRRQFPGLHVSDDDITDCVAGAAIVLDLAVAFDAKFHSPVFQLPPQRNQPSYAERPAEERSSTRAAAALGAAVRFVAKGGAGRELR
ncbi:hypothetical protein [Nitratireductor luteus]|uniref:hypothetical protein n=1 Tax=Nitratireductor luteus TaxID=2976980 RepID=UPI0022400A64|nr:hypothetical protein [Nitratireductor luteus]